MSLVRKGNTSSERERPKIGVQSGRPPTNMGNGRNVQNQNSSSKKPHNYLDRVINSVLYTNQSSKQSSTSNSEAHNQHFNKKNNSSMAINNSNQLGNESNFANRQNPNGRSSRLSSSNSVNKNNDVDKN